MAEMMKPNPAARARNTSVQELLRESLAAYEALPPEEREMHRWAQKISFVRGQLALSNPGYDTRYTREETAIHVLTVGVGIAFALRAVDDPRFRKIVGLGPHE